MSRLLRLSTLLLLLAAPALQAGTPTSPDYADTLFCGNIPSPTAMALAPDGSGRLFVALKDGGVAVVNPAGKWHLFAHIRPIFTASECGVLGLCFDPDFLRNHYLYVFATTSSSQQRIFRLVDYQGLGVARVPLPMVLPTAGRNHDGGALGIGADARLYWAVGDNGIGRGANGDLTSLAAKVGRANLDGTVPRDNPFFDGAGSNNDYIWATGFRNPFALTFQPRTGQLWLNVVGSSVGDGGYEQIFTPAAGEDGGWDKFEGNQPAGARFATPRVRPFAYPVLQYKTDDHASAGQSRAIASLSRHAGVLTVVLKSAHPYRVGQVVVLQEAAPFNGPHVIRTLQDTNGFTAASAGEDAFGASNQGHVELLGDEGCVVGGSFYESTQFPAKNRGQYFFGDHNSGTIWKLALENETAPASITRFVTQAGALSAMTVGRDGAFYYADYDGNAIRRVASKAPADVIVTPTVVRLLEGSSGVFTVRLPQAPAAEVTATIAASASSTVEVVSGSSLTFTPANWNLPQVVKLTARMTDETTEQNALFTVTTPGYADQAVQILVTDITSRSAVVTLPSLEFQARGSMAVAVRLPQAPAKAVAVVSRLLAPGADPAAVTAGRTLLFTPENWDIPQTVQLKAAPVQRERQAVLSVSSPGFFPRYFTLQIHPAP